MDALEKAKEHFRTKLGGQLRSIEAPEWDCTVYYSLAETLEQRDRYYALIADRKLEGQVELLIARARKEDGTPMFSRADKKTLMTSVDPDVVVRVAMHIFMEGSAPQELQTLADAEGPAAKKS